MIINVVDMIRPSAQANRFGLAEAHCGRLAACHPSAEDAYRAVLKSNGYADEELYEETDRDDPDRMVDLSEIGVG
jgi:hypothetical protein